MVKEMKKLAHCLENASKNKVDSREWLRAFLVKHSSLYSWPLSRWTHVRQRPLQRSSSTKRGSQANNDFKTGLKKPDQLKPFPVGQRVAVQDWTTNRWDRCGTVESLGRRRTYNVRTDTGVLVWRNRRFLKPVPGQTSSTAKTPSTPTTGSNSARGKSEADPSKPSPPRRSTRIRRQPYHFQPGQQWRQLISRKKISNVSPFTRFFL